MQIAVPLFDIVTFRNEVLKGQIVGQDVVLLFGASFCKGWIFSSCLIIIFSSLNLIVCSIIGLRSCIASIGLRSRIGLRSNCGT